MGSAEEQGPLWGAAATDWAEVTTQTVAALCELIGAELDVLRSRPNLLIEAAGPTLFPEDAWVGRVLRVGEMRMRVDARDKRCGVVNVDPTTTWRNPGLTCEFARIRRSGVEPDRVDAEEVTGSVPCSAHHQYRQLRSMVSDQ